MKSLLSCCIFLLLSFFLVGCGSDIADSRNDTTTPLAENEEYNGEKYIASIPSDTTPVPSSELASIPKPPRQIPMLVILLEYSNQTIISSDDVWQRKMFGFADKELNAYYKEISRSQCTFEPAQESRGTLNDGIVRITLPKTHLNIDIDDSNFPALLDADLIEALQKVDPYINFARYDSNGNGALEAYELAIVFIVAGEEDAYSGYHVHNGIWAHQNALSNTDAPLLDGVAVCDGSKKGTYAVFGERHEDHDATIGIIAHELGHALFGLPDLYNTSGGAGGIGFFGLMGAGSWTQKSPFEYPGDTPTHMSAWSKSFIHWVNPYEVHNTQEALYATTLSSYNVIKIPISANHYYLLENRYDSGFDRGLRSLAGYFKGGILIWHINNTKLTKEEFLNNTVNSTIYDKGVDVVEANDPVLDSDPQSGGNAHALFYKSNRASFGSKITNISDPASVMRCDIH